MAKPDFTNYVHLIMRLFRSFEQARAVENARGHPHDFRQASLVVFFMMMQCRRIFHFQAQVRWLNQHPLYLCPLELARVPHRTTLARRYKQLYPTLQAFVVWVGQYGYNLDERLWAQDCYIDKSLFKALGPVWHQSDRVVDRVPAKLRHLDRAATWDKSGYHGWVYGYGMHLLCQGAAFPLQVQVETASISEAQVVAQWETALLQHQPTTVTGDNGYFQVRRVQRWAKAGVLLLTPARAWQKGRFAAAFHRFRRLPTQRRLLAQRRISVEPAFDLIAKVLGSDKNHKQLPLQGLPKVRTCLALATLSVQVAMLANSIWSLPLRSISEFLAAFA
jgi:hypothetical protein